MKGLLPEAIVADKRKRRFATPFAKWMRDDWRPMIQGLLLDRGCQVACYLDVPRFRHRLTSYFHGERQALPAITLWRILQTELWMQAFAGKLAPTPDRAALKPLVVPTVQR
jgi:hypothetical protein